MLKLAGRATDGVLISAGNLAAFREGPALAEAASRPIPGFQKVGIVYTKLGATEKEGIDPSAGRSASCCAARTMPRTSACRAPSSTRRLAYGLRRGELGRGRSPGERRRGAPSYRLRHARPGAAPSSRSIAPSVSTRS